MMMNKNTFMFILVFIQSFYYQDNPIVQCTPPFKPTQTHTPCYPFKPTKKPFYGLSGIYEDFFLYFFE